MLYKFSYRLAFFGFIVIAIAYMLVYSHKNSAEHSHEMNAESNSVKFIENQRSQNDKSISSSRNTIREQDINERNNIIRFFESTLNSNELPYKDLLRAVSIAEQLGKEDAITGIEVIRIINSSKNYSLKYNFCATFLMHIEAKNMIIFYNFAKENPIVIDKFGTEYHYSNDIASRIFNFGKDEMLEITHDFSSTKDTVISNAIAERINNMEKFLKLHQESAERQD